MPVLATGAQVSPPSEGNAATFTDAADDSKSDTDNEQQPKERSWYLMLAVCALVLMAFGVFVAWRWIKTSPPLVSEQRITANPADAPVTGAVVSPDGKYVAYSDTTGLYIRHIDSGETRELRLPQGFDAVPASWFPDSTYLLLSVVESAQTAPSLWKVSILGGSPQKVIENASEGTISPDGSKIAFLRDAVYVRGYIAKFTGYGREIWLVETNGNQSQALG